MTFPPVGPPPAPPSEGQDREEVAVPPVHQRTDDRSERPKKSKGKLFATIACLLAVLIGGVSYYHYEYVPTQRRQARESEHVAKVSGLLSGAAEDLARDRLTSPSRANAWEKYQAVLSLEPGHKIASAGLDSIIGRYVSKFDASLGRREFAEAEGYVSRIQSVYADAPVLSELENRLSGAREAEHQAKIAGYEGKFEEALGDRDFDMADRYVDSLRAVNADGTMLSRLSGRLSGAREREADSHRVGRRFRDCAECPEMVVVPSGSFTMGSPSSEDSRDNEGPHHRVNIGYPLAVGVYEVTRREFSRFVSDTGYNAGNSCYVWNSSSNKWENRSGISWRNPDYTQADSHPVVCVSGKDAQSYVRWLSEKTDHRYSLLSESEWEYVARAGTTTPFHFGRTISTDQANYNGNYTYGGGRKGVYRRKTVSVGSFSPNAWGVHDMHGNVWEWVEDCWNDSYVGAPTDGSEWESGACGYRVLRGGSWYNAPRFLRSAYRVRNTTESRLSFYGFRVIRRF